MCECQSFASQYLDLRDAGNHSPNRKKIPSDLSGGNGRSILMCSRHERSLRRHSGVRFTPDAQAPDARFTVIDLDGVGAREHDEHAVDVVCIERGGELAVNIGHG